jgi:hypothetical protein
MIYLFAVGHDVFDVQHYVIIGKNCRGRYDEKRGNVAISLKLFSGRG